MTKLDQLIKSFFFSLTKDLDPTVGEIPCPACHPKPSCELRYFATKEDPLDNSLDQNS